MTPFSENDTDRLDWKLLQDGAVTLYWRREIFDRDTTWLSDYGYRVHVIDCTDADGFRHEITRVLRFKENYGYEPWTGNLNALNDAFRDLDFNAVAGVAFAFARYDNLVEADPDTSQAILDIVESSSRDHLLMGHRLLALVQTDNPRLDFDPIGARTPMWNREEWFNANRGQ